MRFTSRLALQLAIITSVTLTASAQQNYTNLAEHLPSLFSSYVAREVPKPNFANSPRLDQLMRDGKLYLSLHDAIALAMENNLDLAIARYNLQIADTDLLRAKGGGVLRGVATGLVQGTPGGGIGGFGTGASGSGAGGTTGGAGGAGSGSSGLIQSTLGVGPPVPAFDPVVGTDLGIEHASDPQNNSVLTGVSNLRQNTGTANFSYSQGFVTGTSLSLEFNNSRQTSNSTMTTLNPVLSSNFRFSLRQPLLQGLGVGVNDRFIRIARNNREISDVAFRNQVTATVTQIQNIYWDLVNAYEDLKVRERSLALAEQTLDDNRKKVAAGDLADIEITRAEAEVSSREQEIIAAQTNLQLQQLLMKNALTRNITDPVLASAEVVPIDTVQLPEVESVIPVQDLIGQALAARPELAEARIDLTNREINKKAARNALLPTVDLVASYGGTSLAGDPNTGNALLVPGSIPSTGLTDAFSKVFGSDFPTYAVGFSIKIPIRNRVARADQVRSELEYRQSQTRLHQLQNQIAIEVRNAQFARQQNRARVEAAQKARDFAGQALTAETRKYQAGASTGFQLFQAQRDLIAAEANLVAAKIAYEKSQIELDRVIGTTLQRNGIMLEAAERGVGGP